ncbi:MAG: hypothetical protein AB7O59_14375 [Pirellulales bacterium]
MRLNGKHEILLDDGSRIKLVETLATPKSTPSHEVSNNIYRIAADGAIVWQIDAPEGVRERTPFTGLEVHEKEQVVGYRWDGNLFSIDVETGKATFLEFVK